MKRIILAFTLFATPSLAAPADDAKWLLCQSAVTEALKGIGTASRNYVWARDLAAGCAAPQPVPPASPPPAGTSISGQTALLNALSGARGGEVFNLADGRYSLDLTGKRYASPVTVKGGRNVVFNAFAKLADVRNLSFDGVTFAGKAGMVSGQYLLMISNVCDIRFVNVAWLGVDRSGTGITQKSGSSCNVSFTGGTTSALADGHTFANITGLTISNHAFFGQGADDLKLAGVRNVVLSKNRFYGKVPNPGAHPDGVQFQAANDNVTLTGNVLEGRMQGIFGDAAARVTNLTASGNRISVGYPRAFSFAAGTVTGDASDNEIVSPADAKAIIQLGGLRSSGTNRVDGKPF